MSHPNSEDPKRSAQAKYGVPPPRKKDDYGGIFNLNPRSLPVSVHGVSKRFEPDPNSKASSIAPSQLPKGKYKKVPLFFSGQTRPHHYLRFSRSDVDIQKLVPPITLERKVVTAATPEDDDSSIYKTNNGPNTANIAPIGGGVRNKKMLFKKRTKQIYEQDPEARKTRERESRPWVLSDKDDVSHFESNYLGTEKCKYVVLEPFKKGFSVTPLMYHYRFDKRLPFTPMTAEEIEEFSKQKKNVEMDRWFLRQKDKKKSDQDKLLEEEGGAYKGPGMKVSDSGSSKQNMVKGDIDEMDYEEDFQDDDEAIPELGADDEETKETERKIKRSQLQADDDDEDDTPKKQAKISKSNKKVKKIAKKASQSHASDEDLSSEDENLPFFSSDDEDENEDQDEEINSKKMASRAEEWSAKAYADRQKMQSNKNGKANSPKSSNSGPNSPNGTSPRPMSPQSSSQQQLSPASPSSKSPKATDKNKARQRQADPKNPYAPHRPSPLAQVTHINEVAAQQRAQSSLPASNPQTPHYIPQNISKREVVNFLQIFDRNNPCDIKVLFQAFKPLVKRNSNGSKEQISKSTNDIMEILRSVCNFTDKKQFFLLDNYKQ